MSASDMSAVGATLPALVEAPGTTAEPPRSGKARWPYTLALVVITIALGLYPKPVFDVTTPSVAKLISDNKTALAFDHAAHGALARARATNNLGVLVRANNNFTFVQAAHAVAGHFAVTGLDRPGDALVRTKHLGTDLLARLGCQTLNLMQATESDQHECDQ